MPDDEHRIDERLIGKINAYLEQNRDPATPVTNLLDPEELRSRLDLTLPEEGCSLDDLYRIIDEYFEHAVRTGHTQYFNQLWSGFTLPGFLGEVITGLTNTSMYTYEVAPVATLMEVELVRRMGSLAGFEDPEGLFLSGGSNGNLQAMMIARSRALPEAKQTGLGRGAGLAAFVSAEAHYSFEKAANILGVGMERVIKVETDEAGRMLPEDLELKIEDSRAAGLRPFFVGATAGTTVKGAYDPFERIAPLARRHGLWFHVDGSLGGTALLSPRHRHLLEGLEQADSFVWNAHKLMGLPLICSVFLVREKGRLLVSNSVEGADYIFHDDDGHATSDLGPLSLQCGRRVDALKLWLSWKYYGDTGYAERVDRFFNLAEYAEGIVHSTPSLELMAPRSSVTVCFRYRSEDIEDLNAFNLQLRRELARSGKSMVNYAYLGEDMAMRLVIANHELTREDVDIFFQNVLSAAESLLNPL
ncbi:pyridoxal phosphate-dependent decarboxylase family protein [Acidobacteriota bacterium]